MSIITLTKHSSISSSGPASKEDGAPEKFYGHFRHRKLDYQSFEVIPLLPDYAKNERGEEIPSDLLGATIIRFGAAPVSAGLEGGGLIIDYQPRGSGVVIRAVLEFAEVGMWFAYLLPLKVDIAKQSPNQDGVQE